MRLLRRNRSTPPPLGEADVYARSYGERSDDVTNVKRVPAPEPEPTAEEKKLTDRTIRDAFKARLERRDPS